MGDGGRRLFCDWTPVTGYVQQRAVVGPLVFVKYGNDLDVNTRHDQSCAVKWD